jgi:hypothetical protein
LKEFFLQGICDANNRFLSVNSTKPGSCHDSNVFKDSSIGRKCALGRNGFLLGDSGYGCTTHLITPYGTPETPKRFYCTAIG